MDEKGENSLDVDEDSPKPDKNEKVSIKGKIAEMKGKTAYNSGNQSKEKYVFSYYCKYCSYVVYLFNRFP